jgi:hypothetical protein
MAGMQENIITMKKRKRSLLRSYLKGARDILTAELMLPQWKGKGNVMVEVKSIAITGSGGLLERLEEIKDSRGGQGKQHPKKAVLAISILAGFAGMKSYLGIEDFARKSYTRGANDSWVQV